MSQRKIEAQFGLSRMMVNKYCQISKVEGEYSSSHHKVNSVFSKAEPYIWEHLLSKPFFG